MNCQCAPEHDYCQHNNDECSSNPCQNGGTCISQDGSSSFMCHCHYGFTGTTCGKLLLVEFFILIPKSA